MEGHRLCGRVYTEAGNGGRGGGSSCESESRSVSQAGSPLDTGRRRGGPQVQEYSNPD